MTHKPNALILKAFDLGFETYSNPALSEAFNAEQDALPASAERPYGNKLEDTLHYRGMWPSEIFAFEAGYFSADPETGRDEHDPDCPADWAAIA